MRKRERERESPPRPQQNTKQRVSQDISQDICIYIYIYTYTQMTRWLPNEDPGNIYIYIHIYVSINVYVYMYIHILKNYVLAVASASFPLGSPGVPSGCPREPALTTPPIGQGGRRAAFGSTFVTSSPCRVKLVARCHVFRVLT